MCCSSFRAHQIIIAFLWLKQNFTHDTSKQMIYIYISPFTTFFTNFITISPMILLCPLNFGKIGDLLGTSIGLHYISIYPHEGGYTIQRVAPVYLVGEDN